MIIGFNPYSSTSFGTRIPKVGDKIPIPPGCNSVKELQGSLAKKNPLSKVVPAKGSRK